MQSWTTLQGTFESRGLTGTFWSDRHGNWYVTETGQVAASTRNGTITLIVQGLHAGVERYVKKPDAYNRRISDFAGVGTHVEPDDIPRRLLSNGTAVHVRNVDMLGRRAWEISAAYDYSGEIDPGIHPNAFGAKYAVDQQTGVVLSSPDWRITKLVVDKPLPKLHASVPAGSQVGVTLNYGAFQGRRYKVIKKLPATMTLDDFVAQYLSTIPPNWQR